jgi:HK97 family phage portal protein
MGALSELFSPRISAAGNPGPLDDFWYQPIGFATDSGEHVNPETAMRIATVFACVRVLAEAVAGLPMSIYKRRKSGGKDIAADHWLHNLVHNTPNTWQTSFGWREMGQGHLCLRGNSYSVIDWRSRGRRGAVADQLIPIHPDRMTVKRQPDGRPGYMVKDWRTGAETPYDASEILHIPALSFDGLTGLSPVAYQAQTLGLSMAAERFGARFFKNGAKASGVVTYPGPLSETGQRNLRDSVMKHISGDNMHRPLVLEQDAKWTQLSVNPDDAQFLETRKYQDVDICKIFRVPPHMVGILDKATFSNIEHQGIDFVVHVLRPWVVRWEQVINKQLLHNGETYFCKLNVAGLLRGDIKSRYLAYGKAINDGWLTRAEARDFEDLNPIDGLDEPLVPMNMQKANQANQAEQTGPAAGHVGAIARLVIEDAADKIAAAEIKAIAGRIDKADADRERFKTWLQDYYCKQSHYIGRNVALVSRITGRDGDAIPSAIVRTAVNQFDTDAAATDLFDVFQADRRQQIEHILTEVLT